MNKDPNWHKVVYSGDLNRYTYPDIECGDLLHFLKQVSSKKKICLVDIMDWRIYLPMIEYDVYIICSFGEFVNEDFLYKIDDNPTFNGKTVILLTSQYWESNRFKNIKVFYVEHLHTITRFFNPVEFKRLANRTYTHGILSRRTAFHKSYTLINLLERFSTDVRYTFCHEPTHEYKLESLDRDLNIFYPGIALTEKQYNLLEYLHANPICEDGGMWSVDNIVYTESKLMWVPESVFLSRLHAPSAYLTEKTFKAIVSQMPFVLVGQKHSYTRLESLGFVTFNDILKISFDELSDCERFARIVDIMDSTDFAEILADKHTQEMADYNYNYFFNGFVNNVNKQNKQRIEQVLDYINEA